MERNRKADMKICIWKYSIVAFIAMIFGFLFNQSFYLASGLVLVAAVVFMSTKYSSFFWSNILLLLTILLLFSGDSFILNLANEPNIYGLFSVWKFSIFEWWVAGLFFSFLLYRLKIAKEKQESIISIGPLKPLLFFVAGGLILGVFGTLRNHGDLSFSQIRYYCEGIMLYLLVLNIDFKKDKIKPFLYFIGTLVSVKALYYLILYIFGQGFNFGSVGRIVMGYGDILQNVVLVSLLTSSALIFVKNLKKPLFITATVCLFINSVVILLSLRRANIGIFFLGLVIILFFSELKSKLKFVFLVGVLLSLVVGSLFLTNNSMLLNKVARRIDSINVFKYQNDTGGDITSSSGHISEFMNGWRNVRQNIWLGKGFGVEIQKVQGWKHNYMMVHNALFFYWIRMGIFGMLMFFSMYLIPILYCLKRIRDISFREYKWLYLAVMAFIVGKFLTALTVVPPISLFITKSYIYFMLLGFVMNKKLTVKENI